MTEATARRIYQLDKTISDVKCPKCDRTFRFEEEVAANLCATCVTILYAYQKAIATKFPSVLIDIGQGDGTMIVSAFGIPDGRSGEFMEFLLDDLPAMLAEKDVQYLPVIPYSESATKKHFPETMEKLRKELSRLGVI